MENKAENNKEQSRFEVSLGDGEFAVLEYRWYDEKLALMHTFVPPAYQGKGIAASLAKSALEYAESEGLKVLVYCPYVNVYLKKHPQYSDVVASRHEND